MKTVHFIFWLSLFTLHSPLFTAYAYRIEISNQAAVNTRVFLACYYGGRASVIDSTMTDAGGSAVFERDYDLCAGLYTVVAPGKLQCDLLLDTGQQLRIKWLETGEVCIDGDEQTAAYAACKAWTDLQPDKEQVMERRQQLTGQYPNTFLAAYLAALQPVEPPDMKTTNDVTQMMKAYRYRRSHFFDNMSLSDVRLLRTPLYHETIHYFITKFVTQQTDSLIFIAYNMLEQASGNCETFFYISDFLLDFSLRNRSIKDINKLYNFVQRNRDMIGAKGMTMLPGRHNVNYFALADERTLKNRIENMPMTDIEGQTFSLLSAKYRVFYFWKNDCPRCLADISQWQTVLKKYEKSCMGIAVNINDDVQKQENRILAYDPLCTNVSIVNTPVCGKIFFAANYSKIVMTDAEGNIIGLFGSVASFDNFFKITK
jgi:hypothetical protein